MPFDFDSVGEFLRCPVSRAELVKRDDRLISKDPETRLAYPIKDGIPNLLPDEATTLSEEEWKAAIEASNE